MLGLAVAVAVATPDGHVSIHGGRASLAYRVTMFASRHFQKLDEEAAPTAGAAPAAEADAAPALPPAEDAGERERGKKGAGESWRGRASQLTQRLRPVPRKTQPQRTRKFEA